MHRDFVYLDEALPGVRWDAKYATKDNFTGDVVPGYGANRVVGSLAVARALAVVKEEAEALGYGLLLWDSYRPQRAVDAFVRWSETPTRSVAEKERYYPNISKEAMFEQGYVATRSAHSRGCAIDLTLYRLADGALVDMGGAFDLMDAVSHHDSPLVSEEARMNRNILRTRMSGAGFEAYALEWWHYSLKAEPYPNTYFDWCIE
ncbi:MAG: M15 family metallopeptidase [Bacilli bacterium]